MEDLWTAILTCADCGHELNRARHVPEWEKSRVSVSSALAAGLCPNKCRSTWSDCNINTNLKWKLEETQPNDGGSE